LSLILGASVVSYAAPAASPPAESPAPSPALATKGRPAGALLFVQYRCARCHTLGRGAFVGPDLLGVGGRWSRDEIEKWIVDPRLIYGEIGRMPANEGYPPMPTLGVPPGDAARIAEYISGFEPSPAAAAARGGIVEGTVRDGATGEPVRGVKVNLTAYMGEVEDWSRSTTTDDTGAFRFEGLPWNRSYEVSVLYGGTRYHTESMVFLPGEVVRRVALKVYETVRGEAPIRVDVDHMIVEFSGDAAVVAQITFIRNDSTRTWVGNDEGTTLVFSLPEGAMDVTVLEGLDAESLTRTEDGFASKEPVPPGVKSVAYTYRVPLRSEPIEKVFHYPTSSFTLLSSTGGGVKLSPRGLGAPEAVEIEGERFLKWTAQDIAAGKRLVMDVSLPLRWEDYAPWAALAVLALVLGAAVAYRVLGARGSEGIDERRVHAAERSLLIEEIARLDERFERGEIGRKEYLVLRARKKERAVELTKLLAKPS